MRVIFVAFLVTAAAFLSSAVSYQVALANKSIPMQCIWTTTQIEHNGRILDIPSCICQAKDQTVWAPDRACMFHRSVRD